MGRHMENYEIEACTKAAHEVNRAFCEAMNDFSHKPWDQTEPELKAIAKQATIGIVTLEHTPEQSHEAWVASKRAQGWNIGPKKDEKKKLHPCLVSWADLAFEQQAKDELWVKTVKNMMEAFFRIPRQ